MPGAISDSSTLIHLARVGHLGLLREFYGQVTVPPAVWREVVEEGEGRPGAREVEEAQRSGWLSVVAPANTSLLRLLDREINEGEAEVIALALEQAPEVILLDESDARRVAEVYGVPKTGVVGLLIRARIAGKISSLRSELDRLRRDAGFWITDDLQRQALEAVGEGEDT
jgi:uncharacterized protein